MQSLEHKKNSIAQKNDAWDRFVNGDVFSFETVFKKYYDQMYGYGLKLCGRSDIVKDSIQELFITLWEKRSDLSHVETPQVYLFVSLRRKILKKKKTNDRLFNDADERDEKGSIKFSIEDLIIKNETKHQQKDKLKGALNKLSDRQKEVIYLHFYHGMSYGEIQQILSINRQSVRNHVYRAMESLRSMLNNELVRVLLSLLLFFLPFC